MTAYEEGYADGFDRGEEAVVQQVDGIIYNAHSSMDAVEKLTEMIDAFWKERES